MNHLKVRGNFIRMDLSKLTEDELVEVVFCVDDWSVFPYIYQKPLYLVPGQYENEFDEFAKFLQKTSEVLFKKIAIKKEND